MTARPGPKLEPMETELDKAQNRPTALERAFALAASGRYRSAGEIKVRLREEGYSTAQIAGPALLRQLRSICISAQKRPKERSRLRDA